MKRCPECHELFNDSQKFCELHGLPLVDETTEIREILQPAPYRGRPDVSGTVATVVIGILVGVVLSLLGYVLFFAPSRNDKSTEKHDSGTQMASSRPEQVVTTAPRERETPAAIASPSPEATEEASPSPSPVATSSPESAPVAAMNEGPISTGAKRGSENGQALIKMKDGSSVEADAAWEDAQGVWYRRGNMVSFVERSRVDKITAISTKRTPAAEESRP